MQSCQILAKGIHDNVSPFTTSHQNDAFKKDLRKLIRRSIFKYFRCRTGRHIVPHIAEIQPLGIEVKLLVASIVFNIAVAMTTGAYRGWRVRGLRLKNLGLSPLM